MNLKLVRTDYDSDLTDGKMYDDQNKAICFTLELPNLNNQPEVSCIPEGQFSFHKFFSSTLGWVYRLDNVPNRSLIDIHKANVCPELRGCIAVGLAQGTLDVKGKTYPAVLQSAEALQKLFDIVGNSGTITITSGTE